MPNDTLLLIMNPRSIPECIDAIRDLRGIDKAWLSYYTELELEQIIPTLIDQLDYRRISIISDDTTPTQAALDEVLELHDALDEPDNASACGWVNIDASCGLSTFHPQPLRGTGPSRDTYRFATLDDAHKISNVQRTYFHAMTFHTMTRELWQRYPFATYNGCASDLHQCVRLQADNVPIYTTRNAYVAHVKEIRDQLDTAHHKRLLIGERAPRITIEREHA
jgi:hypothetical protein